MKIFPILFWVVVGLTKINFVVAQVNMTEIKPILGEKWYGAYTAKAYCNTPIEKITFQPFGNDEPLRNLKEDNKGNQAAPILLSNKGRYVWGEKPFSFEFKEGVLKIYSEFEKIKIDVDANRKNLREAYIGAMHKWFPPSGKTPNPLMFKMPQYNMWIELNYHQNQEKVLRYANDIGRNAFPTGVFMLDDIWSKYYGNFEFDPAKFPNPKAMVNELHGKGFKIMLWLTPFVSPDSKEFRFLEKNNCLILKRGINKPAMVHWWNGYSACLDLLNPKAVKWLREQLQGLKENYGIDGFKFDAADFDFYSNTSSVYPNELTNAEGFEQAEAYAKFGSQFDFNEFRACWKNGNQPNAQRLQDKGYSWGDLKLLIPDIISAGLIGYPYTCPDMIGGGLLMNFEHIDFKKFDQELLVRSAQVQSLMPMMQFSVAPWRVLDSFHLSIVHNAASLHVKMGEYIYGLAQKAALNGEPIVRHLEYVFPNEGFESCDDQFMLGDKFLVAPMIEKGMVRKVKLPIGNWIDELGNRYTGGKSVQIQVPIDRLPYFEKSN